MIRCGVDKDIYCEFRRKEQCENAQDVCPIDDVIELFEGGKSIDYIVSVTSFNELEINDILKNIINKSKKETIKTIKRHLKGIEKAVKELEKE